MQKELTSSLKITLLLYIIVLILPFGFYFVYTSFQSMQKDTKIVHKIEWIGNTASKLALIPLDQNNQRRIESIDNSLQEVSLWVQQNNNSKFYIGANTLTKDFSNIQSSWDTYKEEFSKHNAPTIKKQLMHYWGLVDNFSIVIEKMVYLKQNKIINIFYLSLSSIMILVLLIIYMVRIYIHKQMKKHAIHDHETKLFNKKYFMAEFKTTCSRSARHNYPLSILCVSIDNFEKENKTYNNRTKRNTLKVFGILMHALVRDGDIACRYDENHFFLLLPFTEQENALILGERIRQTLEKDNWMRSKKIVFKFKTTEFDKKESEEAFITRTLDGCELRG